MSIKRGVIANYTSSATSPIEINTVIPIALVLTASVGVTAGLYGFDSVSAALAHDEIKTSTEGNILKYLEYAENKYNLVVPIVLSVAHADADSNVEKANVINAVYALRGAIGEFGFEFKPDVIAVADWTADADVRAAYEAVLAQLLARGFVNLDAVDNASALVSKNAMGSSRITPVFTSLMDYNPTTQQTEEYCPSVLLTLFRAVVDATPNKPGYSLSLSSRTLPVAKPKQKRDFFPGMPDETDPLTEENITSFINFKGTRVWHYGTCSIDPMWQDARRVRVFDMAVLAVIDGIFYVVDKDLSELDSAKKTLRALMRSMVGEDVMLGFNVELDLKKTTPAMITANKFFFKIESQEAPSPILIGVTFDRVDAYASVVYERLGA